MASGWREQVAELKPLAVGELLSRPEIVGTYVNVIKEWADEMDFNFHSSIVIRLPFSLLLGARRLVMHIFTKCVLLQMPTRTSAIGATASRPKGTEALTWKSTGSGWT